MCTQVRADDAALGFARAAGLPTVESGPGTGSVVALGVPRNAELDVAHGLKLELIRRRDPGTFRREVATRREGDVLPAQGADLRVPGVARFHFALARPEWAFLFGGVVGVVPILHGTDEDVVHRLYVERARGVEVARLEVEVVPGREAEVLGFDLAALVLDGVGDLPGGLGFALVSAVPVVPISRRQEGDVALRKQQGIAHGTDAAGLDLDVVARPDVERASDVERGAVLFDLLGFEPVAFVEDDGALFAL